MSDTEASPLRYDEARDAILAILDRVPTHALPEGRIEHHNGATILWFGGHGRHLGSARRGGELDPSIYHRDAAETALELEATYRADLAHQAADPVASLPTCGCSCHTEPGVMHVAACCPAGLTAQSNRTQEEK